MNKLTSCTVDDFISVLFLFPLDVEVISDAVYNNSKTMNGHHFAEEFIRRKRQADKGVIERQPVAVAGTAGSANPEGKAAGGWSEVAKKGGHKEAQQAETGVPGVGFKVVSGRKKGKK